ncbi:MAG: hypothetical protein LQ340_006167 [Diploschistes diacapsis]|nr:MAG: hypothetical protein LQ340_006167 [Diploschistes diacapsis]
MVLIHLELSLDTLEFHDANAGTKQYARLAAQADYFGVDRLKKWISDRKYEAVVSSKKSITADTLLDPTPGDRFDIRPDEKLVRTHWSVEKHFVCAECRTPDEEHEPAFLGGPVMRLALEREQLSFEMAGLTDDNEASPSF